MQWTALDSGLPLSAHYALKKKNYTCPECFSPVRLRSGPHRRAHFYHLFHISTCKQRKKTLEHLNLQHFLLSSFPHGEAQMERLFPSIKRIADIAWEPRRLIFEIQCSPITLSEAQERCEDYGSIGYDVIWILHDKRFNRRRLSAAEAFLRTRTCYFSNMHTSGKGMVYDQFEVLKGHCRLFKGEPLRIDPSLVQTVVHPSSFEAPLSIQNRAQKWRWRIEGDLLSRLIKGEKMAEKFLNIEERLLHSRSKKRLSLKALLKACYFHFFEKLMRSL